MDDLQQELAAWLKAHPEDWMPGMACEFGVEQFRLVGKNRWIVCDVVDGTVGFVVVSKSLQSAMDLGPDINDPATTGAAFMALPEGECFWRSEEDGQASWNVRIATKVCLRREFWSYDPNAKTEMIWRAWLAWRKEVDNA